jgi:hypothetical protein
VNASGVARLAWAKPSASTLRRCYAAVTVVPCYRLGGATESGEGRKPPEIHRFEKKQKKIIPLSICPRAVRRQVESGSRRSLPATDPQTTNKERTMRVMVIVKATKASEAGEMPSEKLMTEMGNYNEQLVKAGIMLAGEGLHPTNKGKRVRFAGGKKSVIDGPFTEVKELIAGYWLWQVKSMEEAVEWVRRCPDPMPGEEAEIEIRPVFEASDFGAEYTPELQAQEAKLRAEVERQQNKS